MSSWDQNRIGCGGGSVREAAARGGGLRAWQRGFAQYDLALEIPAVPRSFLAHSERLRSHEELVAHGDALRARSVLGRWMGQLDGQILAKQGVPYGSDGASPDYDEMVDLAEEEDAFEELVEAVATGTNVEDALEDYLEEVWGPGGVPVEDGPCDTIAYPSQEQFPTTGKCLLLWWEGSCDAYTPCLDEQADGCDVAALPTEEAEGYWNLDWFNAGAVGTCSCSGAPPLDEYDHDIYTLLNEAWAVLVANQDLVDWIACLTFSPEIDWAPWLSDLLSAGSVGDCLLDLIGGVGKNVTIRGLDLSSIDGTGAFAAVTNRQILKIPNDGAQWCSYRCAYNAASAEEKFCIAADLAATILHEMVHMCPQAGALDTPFGEDAARSCSAAYVVENMFRWALSQRYPCLSTTTCCFFSDSGMWRNDDLTYFNQQPSNLVGNSLCAQFGRSPDTSSPAGLGAGSPVF